MFDVDRVSSISIFLIEVWNKQFFGIISFIIFIRLLVLVCQFVVKHRFRHCVWRAYQQKGFLVPRPYLHVYVTLELKGCLKISPVYVDLTPRPTYFRIKNWIKFGCKMFYIESHWSKRHRKVLIKRHDFFWKFNGYLNYEIVKFLHFFFECFVFEMNVESQYKKSDFGEN